MVDSKCLIDGIFIPLMTYSSARKKIRKILYMKINRFSWFSCPTYIVRIVTRRLHFDLMLLYVIE